MSATIMLAAHRLVRFLLGGSLLTALAACAQRSSVEGDSATARTPADAEAAFRAQIGRTWELARLGARGIPEPAPGTPLDSPGRDLVPGRRPTLRFSADPPGAGGRSFCNGYGGPIIVRGDSLRITQIESTAVGCDGADSLETLFFRGLRQTRRFELGADSLRLIAEDGSALVLVPTSH